MEKQIIALDNLSASNLPELQGFKEKQTQLVAECPYVEIIDNQTYELAKKHRTALLKGRTTLESQDKLIASKLTGFRKEVANATKELIEITLLHEEKQQAEVKRYEAIKEAEKAEREHLENERIEKIKSKISEFENDAYSKINSWTTDFLKIQHDYVSIVLESVTNFDFEEFDILFQQAKLRVQEHAQNKVNSLAMQEQQRIENERLAREKAEADAKLKAIEEKQLKEAAERSMKEQAEKEKVFEVRKNRLIEIGLVKTLSQGFSFVQYEIPNIPTQTIYDADVIDFENILTNAKKLIQEAKDNKEKAEAEKQAQEKAELEAKKKAEKENKERQKRLSKDKAIYKKALQDNLGSFPIVFDADQEEIKNFSIEASSRVTDLLVQLLNELENL